MYSGSSRAFARVLAIGVVLAPVVGICDLTSLEHEYLHSASTSAAQIKFNTDELCVDSEQILSDFYYLMQAFGFQVGSSVKDSPYPWEGPKVFNTIGGIYDANLLSSLVWTNNKTYVTLNGLISGFSGTNSVNAQNILNRSVGLLEYAGRTSDDLREALYDVRTYPLPEGPNPVATTTTVAQAVVDIRDMLAARDPTTLITNVLMASLYPVAQGAANASNMLNAAQWELSEFLKGWDNAVPYVNSVINGIYNPELDYPDEFYEDISEKYGFPNFTDVVNDSVINYEYGKLQTSVRSRVSGNNSNHFLAYNTYYLYNLLKHRWFSSTHGEGLNSSELAYEVGQINTNDLNSLGVADKLAKLDLGDDINPLVDKSYDGELSGVEDNTDADDSSYNLKEIIGEVGDNLEDWVDGLPAGSQDYNLQLRVAMPVVLGQQSSEFYIDFTPDANLYDKFNHFWDIIEVLVHLGCYVYGAIHLWNMLLNRESLHGTDILGSD